MGISNNAFEDKSGLSRGTITNLKHGIRSDKLAGILRAFPEVNPRWLILGEGSPIITEDEPKEEPMPRMTEHKHTEDDERMKAELRKALEENTWLKGMLTSQSKTIEALTQGK